MALRIHRSGIPVGTAGGERLGEGRWRTGRWRTVFLRLGKIHSAFSFHISIFHPFSFSLPSIYLSIFLSFLSFCFHFFFYFSLYISSSLSFSCYLSHFLILPVFSFLFLSFSFFIFSRFPTSCPPLSTPRHHLHPSVMTGDFAVQVIKNPRLTVCFWCAWVVVFFLFLFPQQGTGV